jgi:hypothetical protein
VITILLAARFAVLVGILTVAALVAWTAVRAD